MAFGQIKPTWKPEHGNRGTTDQDIRNACVAFITEFPYGTRLATDQFDAWLERQGLLNVPVNVSKRSDAWKAHLQRRHEIKRKMTTFSTTTKIRRDGTRAPFVIETIAGSNGQWEVRSPEHAISLKEPGLRVQKLVDTNRRKIEQLMASADWERLPPYMKVFARSLLGAIDTFKSTIDAHGSGLDRQFQELQNDLKELEREGVLKSANGGIKAITSDSDVDDDEEV